jgi:DNA-binding CsgD family transcriptional regulator
MAIQEADLVGDFYEAAFDAARFPEALRQLGAFAGGIGSVLLVWDRLAARALLFATAGHSGPDAAEAYRDHYAALDPYRPLIDALPVGGWSSCAAFFDDRFVARSAFYNEYLIPRGIRYMAAARLLARDRFDIYLGVHRGPRHTPFAHHELQRLESIGRHLGRAAGAYLDVTQTRLGHAVGLGALEQIAKPALLADVDARVVYANPAAETAFRSGAFLAQQQGRLAAATSTDSERLHALVERATRYQAGGELRLGAPAPAAGAVVTVTPAGRTMTLDSLAPTAVALVMLHDPRNIVPPASRLQTGFGLTKAEAALARGLIAGQRLTEIAAARRVSIETVRTQLRALFRKTGTTRQPDLVRVLLAAADAPAP